MKILVVEDEPAIARVLEKELVRCGHLVDKAEDGREAKDRIEVYDYDIIILDIMLPEADGFSVCRHIRDLGLDAKVMMLTAKDDIDSKVKSLNMGADDYMVKPFSFEELDARVRALGRREKLVRKNELKVDSLSLDLETRTVRVNGKPIKTRLIEFRLLEYLIRNQSRYCTKTMLTENVWGEKPIHSNVIAATISRLRAKLREANKGRDIIHTLPKSGYRVI